MMLPNGMFVMKGPFEGRRHDAALLASSDLINGLREHHNNTGKAYAVFGDSAFPRTHYSMAMFKGNLTYWETVLNAIMSKYDPFTHKHAHVYT